MSPDSYEPMEHKYPETEMEMTFDGKDYLVVGVVVETRSPVMRPDGKLRSEYSYSWDTAPSIYPVEDPSYGYADNPLTGLAASTWVTLHGETAASLMAEKINDDWVAHMEERDSRY